MSDFKNTKAKKAAEDILKKYGAASSSSKSEKTTKTSTASKNTAKKEDKDTTFSGTKAKQSASKILNKYGYDPNKKVSNAVQNRSLILRPGSGIDSLDDLSVMAQVRNNPLLNPTKVQPETLPTPVRDATLKDLTINSLKRGYYNSALGRESYHQMMGAENEKEKYEDILTDDDYRFEADKWYEKALSGAAEFLGQKGYQVTDPRAIGAGTSAAIGAGLLGQAGPQIALPEEVITMPAAFLAGFNAGSTTSNYEIEAGHSYNELISSGVSHDTAQKIAAAVGLGNALLEAVQLDELTDAYKALKRTGADKGLVKTIARELGSAGIDVAKETVQEVAQEGVTVAGTQLGSKLETGEYAYDTKEVLGRLGDTAVESALAFGMLNAPAAGVRAASGVKNTIDQKRQTRAVEDAGQFTIDNDIVSDVIQTGLESDKETESYRLAVELFEKQNSGQALTNREVGNLYAENIRTIRREQGNETQSKPVSRETNVIDNYIETVSRNAPKYTWSFMNAVRSLGDNGAKALGQFYKGETDFDSYYAGFSRYYEAGVSNVPFEKINTEYAKNISEAVKYAAYSAGQNDAKISLKQEIKDSKFAKVYGKEGGLILDDVAKSLKPRLQETLNTVAKVSGTKIKIVESISTGDSEAGANGYYKSSEGIIYIAKDADNPLFVVAKHEITHHMQKVAPKEYRAYRDYVMSVISDGQAVDTIVEQKRAQYASAGQNLSVEEAMDEIVADYTEQIIKDEKVLNEFISKGEKSVVQKFFDSVREFINRVKKAFKGDKTKMDAAAEETYGATISELERAEQLWLDALKATKKKADKGNQNVKDKVSEGADNAQKIKADKNDVGRLSIKNSVGKIEQFIEDRNDTELYDYENAKELYTKQKNLYSKYQEGTANKDNFMVNTIETENVNISYSLKGNNDILKENERLKEYNEYLKEQMKLTKDIKQDKKAMEKLSKGILKDYSSEMDSAELLGQLNEVYSYIANSDSPSWDELKPMARRVAGNILSRSVAIDDEAYQSYKDLITGLSRTRINLSKDYRNGLKDGYEEFRKANFGKFRLVNSGGRDVDVLYNELADTYPELFDAEKYTHPVDQLEHIAEVLDGLKPVEENPYSYDMRNATEWLANEIIDRYFEVPQAKKTFADKQADKLTKEKIKGAEKLANQKERYENKIADIKLHSKQRIAEAVKREKAAKWDKVAQVKQAQREKESRLSDRRKHSLYVNKIRKHAAKISKMLLNPTETSHVPEPLRKPVAEFLSLFDMTSDRMEEKSIQKFKELREAYLKIADSADATLMDIDPDLDANLEQIIEAFKGNGDLRISNMSAKDTETLYRAVMAVERSIYSYNKLMNDEKQATIADYGESAMEELATKHPFQEKRGVARVVGDTLNMDMVAPAEFFDELGGTMKSLYDDIRKGFDKKISNLEIARAYMEKLTKGIALKEITGNKARTTSFELSGGKIELTKAQVMSLYLLNKQPDAQEHIYTGGIKAAPIIARGEKGRRARIQKSFEAIKVTPEDVDEIIGSMSKEEKALADGIGKFFTDYTAEWGNEVSEKLYGYRKFTVENYFPIVSDKNYINQVFGETTDVTLKNMGSTKSRVKGANNPIIIEDVIDVFTRQVDSMASYNAFVIPLNDIQKVYNYKNINGSVKQSIEKKFGTRANKCFSTFITDMNGGGKFDGGTGTFNFMLGKYKQAKMGLNLRVVLQQPTSYLRAAAVINPKYLTKAAASPKKVDYNLVMKYAPIARWKDWGHFSLDTSKSMKSIIMEKKEMSDYTMALAKQADRLTWGRLWKAAEYEIQDKHPGLRKGSEEYYQAVGERFSEIIDKTQVVDSTLHRPQIMRRKDGLTRMTMSFMSEPMRSYNLLRTALREAKVNPGKEATKLAFAAVTAYMTQVIVNHIITGFVDTLRGDDDDQFFIDKLMGLFDGDDDDDDETALTFEQRWIKHFVDNLINEPLSMFPAVKDVWSVVQGFSVERMDMASIGDLFSAVKRTFSDKYTLIFKMADVGSKVLDMFGVPASSFKREVATGAKLALGVSGNPVMEYKSNKYLYNVKSNKKMYMDLLYKTMKSGDMESYYAIVEDMVNSGVPGSDIESAMRSRAKKDSEMGTDISNFDSTLAGIGIKYQNPEEKKEDDKFKVEDLDGAGYVEYSSIKQDILNQLISDFKTRGFGDLDEETANDILSAAYTYSESVALQKASDGAYEEDTKWINLAETSLEDLGISIAEYIELKEEYGDSSLRAKGTYRAAEMGIDLDKYLEASEFKYDAKADYYTDSNGNPVLDKNGNKKTIPYSKQNKVKAYMNGMDLTEEEYEMIWDILYP